jgi:hypothetical protein
MYTVAALQGSRKGYYDKVQDSPANDKKATAVTAVSGETEVPQSRASRRWFKLSGATVKKSIDKYLAATNQKMQQSDPLWNLSRL